MRKKRGKRIVAMTVGLAMAAGTLVSSLAGSAGAAAPNIDAHLRPPEGQTAVKNGDTVTFEGSISPGSVIEDAFLRFLTPAGEKARNDIDVTGRLTIESGGLAGTRVLPSLPAEANNGDAKLHVLAVNPDTGEQSTGVSPGVTIDLVPPVITGTFLTSARKIRVDFSEAVETPAIFEPGDWRVDDTLLPPSAVSQPNGQPDRRILDLAVIDESKDEDATPESEYRAELVIGHAYEDRAGLALGLPREFIARDLLPPTVVPTITEIAGQAGTDVLSNDPAPIIRLSGLRTTGDGAPRAHKGRIYLENGGQPGFQAAGPSADTLIGIGENDGSGGTIIETELTLGEDGLGSDGTYTLYAVAADRALCSPPSGTEECPNLSEAASATYTLDTIAPTPEYAAMIEEGARTIDVKFTEDIAPSDGSPVNWTVTAGGVPVLVESVSGSGNARRLILSSAIPGGVSARVAWTGGDYADAAGNALEPFDLPILDAVPPVITLTDPLARRWIRAGSYTIQGVTTHPGSTVEVYQDMNRDGEPDAAPLTDVADGAGMFAITVDLSGEGDYDFLVRGRRTDPDVVGQALAVPTIIKDTTAPQATMLAPGAGDIFRGGEETDILWNATDANIGPGAITIEFKRPGQDWETVAAAETNDGDHPWTVPAVNTDSAQVRVIAKDRAGNASTPAVSDAFEIDSIAPRFDSTTVDTTTAQVQFTEPVIGVTDPAQWLISRDGTVADRRPPSTVTPQGAGAVTELVLRTLPANGYGTNATPEVIYVPGPTGQVFEDEAGNTVPLEQEPPPEGLPEFPHARVIAADGIIPVLASLDEIPRVVDAGERQIAGAADSGEQNEAIGRRRFSRKGGQFFGKIVNDDGTFSFPVRLRKNKKNHFDIKIQDPSGNVAERSDLTRVVIIEDSIRPRVSVRSPNGGTVRGGKKITIRWRTRDANKDTVRIIRQIRGRSSKVIAESTKDDGGYRWRLPKNLRGKQLRIKIVATDDAGHKDTDYGRWARGR